MNKIREDISKWPIERRVDVLKKAFKEKMGYELDLENPRYFSEMMQWIKLFYHDPRMTRCADKVTFKEYVKEKLGDGYTAKVYMIWESPDEVDLARIPEKCVIKSNCSSDGYNIILVADKQKFDMKTIAQEIKESWFDRLALHTNSFANYYYDVKPKVIVEEYLEDVASSGADDYDVMCFHGEPRFIYVKSEHFDHGQNLATYPVSFYTLDWEFMDIKYEGYSNASNIPKPPHLEEMLAISKKLATGLPFVRVDFFENPNKLRLAEMAFVAWAGMRHYEPDSFDLQMGKWLDITHTAKKEYVRKSEA